MRVTWGALKVWMPNHKRKKKTLKKKKKKHVLKKKKEKKYRCLGPISRDANVINLKCALGIETLKSLPR